MGSSSSSSANPEYQEGQITDENEQQPHAGDLIEIFRGAFEHWAIYIGSGYVIHLVVKGLGSSSNSRITVPGEKGVVMKQKLKEVVGGDRWRVNNGLDKKYKHRKINDIVKEACGLDGTRVEYNLIMSNCEHFVNDLRYSKRKSRQVIRAAAGLGGALATVLAMTGTVAAAMIGARR